MRMLAMEPAARPASAGALGREALALLATVSAAAPPLDPTRALPSVEAAAAASVPATPDPRGDQTTVVVGRLSTDTDPGFRLPDVSRIPRWLPYALGLAVAAVLLLVLVQSCGADPVSTTPGSGGESSTEPTAATEVDVAARDYLGRPVADVREELVGLGLRVTVARSAGGGVVGTVKDVTPTGTLKAGTPVTLDVVAEQPGTQEPDSTEKDSKPGKGHGRKKGR
jgi:serine/threonine-protein kinase